MIFEADPDQISQLNSVQLVQLMKRLLLAECRLLEIPLRAATVPLQITVADGGEDGRVEWVGGVDATNYFPARFCVLQSKAQNVTEASIAAEVHKKPKKGPAKLNAAVSEVLWRRGAYVIFCSHAFTGQKIKKLRKAITSAITAAGEDPSRAFAIEIYDANRVADWVNTHRSVALWLSALHRRRSVVGFLSHEAWGRAAEVREAPWIANDIPRFAPADLVIAETERKERTRNAWSFEQAANAALRFLAEDNVAVRIAGPSGFGKSRFAFEMFGRHSTTLDEIEGVALIYADLAIVGDEAAKLALDIADAGSPTILVVDECPDETHAKLAAIAHRVGSRLRLVTIDVETKIGHTTDTLVLRLQPAPDEMIGAIARAVAPTLNDSDVALIRELAKGFPQMAVLGAQQGGVGGQVIRSTEQLLGRIIWGRQERKDEAQRALEFLSLFEWIGVGGPVANEGAAVAKLAGIAADTFVEHVKSFGSRGIVVQRGNFMQVTPIPIAACLGAHRLSVLADERLLAFFGEAPDRLKQSLLGRLRWLDTSPEAKAFAQKLLGPDRIGNLAALNTKSGAESLDRLVHVDPDLAMATIQRVFDGLTDQELQCVDVGRRHIEWALEKLAFRKESFDGAATLLRRLAASETESHISNNASGQFKQLYQLYLSGTEAPPEARLLVLDEGLKSLNPKEREVCVGALDEMLGTVNFSRNGGAEEIGSGERLKDWAPRTYGEVRDFFRSAVERLVGIAISDDPLAAMAKVILGSRIRALIGQLPLDDVKAMISRIVSHDGFWAEAVEGVNEWLYFDRKDAPSEIAKDVRRYFDDLIPSDPVELVVLYTHGWQADFHDPDVDYDQEERSQIDFEYATRKAIELADIIAADPAATDKALDRLITSDAKTVYPFTRRLAELVPDSVGLFRNALTRAEQRDEAANRQFFGGLVAGVDSRDPNAARDCVRLALRSEKLRKDAISMIGAGKLQPGDIQLVVSLLQSRDVEPRQCAVLSNGRGMDHLAIGDVLPLLEELALHGPEGLWTVLDIISMILHGGKKPPKPLIVILRNVLVAPALFENLVRGTMDGHHLETLITALARRKLVDGKFARALVKQLLSICAPSNADVFYTLDGPISAALKTLMDGHPQDVWAGVARLLRGSDWLFRRRLEHLIEPEHNNHLGPGLLFALPPDLYLEWARKDAPRRASFIVQWLPIASRAEDGTLSWHPAFEDFIAEFGNQDHVLAAVSSRLHPRSWWGSLVPHIEPQLKLMESWSVHPRPEVRKWARSHINGIRAQIQDARRRDDEDVVRFS